MAKDPIDEFIALPKDQQLSTLQKLSPDKQNRLLGEIKTRRSKSTSTPDFTTKLPGRESEGLYQMTGPGGKTRGIPYSRVREASQGGWKMINPGEIKRYVRDTSVDPNINSMPKGSGVRVVGRNAAGRPILAPEGQAAPVGGPVSRFASNFGQAFSGAASGLYHGVVEGGQNPEEADIERRAGRVGLIAKRFYVDPTLQQARQTASEIQQARAGSPYEHGSKAAAHALATAVPSVGPWWAQVGEQAGTQWGSGDIAGALGTVAGNAALLLAPHAAKGVYRAGGAAARGTAEALTSTGPRGLRKMAQNAVKANTEAARAHLEEVQNALHETSGREMTREGKVRMTDEEARAKHDLAVAKVREANTRARAKHAADVEKVRAENDRIRAKHQAAANQIAQENERVRAKHAADVEKVRAENDRIRAKHQATADQITQENAATDHALELRRGEEAQLQQDTTNYYAKEDAVKAKARGDTNAAWNPWHEKVAGATIDGGEISEPLKKITAISPEVKRMINQLTPDPEDAPPESMYAKDRAAIMKSQGYKEDYWNLSPAKRAEVDKIAASNGFEPAPIDFDPQAGVGIPIEQVHRARSILGKNIYSGRYEGALEGEMKQLLKVLDQAETRASLKAGALDDLKAGRAATQKYQRAFGRERHAPKTQDEIRKKAANPEQFNEENDQERLRAAQEFDPSLVSDYEKVQRRREQLKKMPTEDQLRKSRKQIPEPPSEDDLREGYRLKPEPEPPSEDDLRPGYRLQRMPEPPSEDDLRAGYRLQTEPEPPTDDDLRSGYRLQTEPEPPAPAEETVTQTERAPVPDRPVDQTITPESRLASIRASVGAAAERLRQQGVARTINSLYYTVPMAIMSVGLGHPGYSLAEVAMAPVILAGSHALANLFERPEVVNWISKVTPREVAAFNRLPPEEKAVFTQNLSTMVKAAKKRKIPVAAALNAFVVGSGAGASTPKTLQQLQKEARKRQQGQQQQQPPQPAAPAPPDSSVTTPAAPPATAGPAEPDEDADETAAESENY